MPFFTTSATTFGGLSINRSIFRKLLPDARWFVYAAGLVDPGDANTATISLVYQKDDLSFVTLGTVTQAGSGMVKKSLGPFDVFGTGGVPAGETVPVVRLQAIKSAGANGELQSWTLFTRFLPSKQ